MKKLSKISESVWNDIRKKSLGSSTRKENEWIMELINAFVKRHHLKEGEYTIKPGFIVDVYHSIQLQEDDIIDNRIPFKFGKVEGDFRMSHIPINSLENSPDEVTGDYMVIYTSVTTLEGSPKIVGKNFNVDFNKLLIKLDGSPDKVGGDYKLYACYHIKDIKGISPEIDGNLVYDKAIGFTEDDFRQYSNIKGNIKEL